VSRRCVLLFARAPAVEAEAKGVGRARRLFELTRGRVLAAVAALPGADLVIVGGAGSSRAAHHLAQRGRTFGQRLRCAFADVRALGYERIVAVPIDCPGLGAAHLAAAFRHLDAGQPVLGPSPDGGVYLLGTPADPEGWLRAVSWGTSRVFGQLLATCPGAALLAPLADLDAPRDLAAHLDDPRLCEAIATELRRLLVGGPFLPRSAYGRPARRTVSPLACRPPPLAA
jgi:hypothetical protein